MVRRGLLRLRLRDMLHLLPRRYIISYYHLGKRSVKRGPRAFTKLKALGKGSIFEEIVGCDTTSNPKPQLLC
jgi:hypothetical protein